MRVISLYSRYHCPSHFQMIAVSGKRLCRKKVRAGCSSLPLTVGVPYAEIYGKVRGYAYGSPDAVPLPVGSIRSSEDAYMDDVSITHGSKPPNHIWSYIGGYTEDPTGNSLATCPCAAKGKPLSYNSLLGITSTVSLETPVNIGSHSGT